MSLSRLFFAIWLSLCMLTVTSSAQTVPSGDAKLALNAALVLTPEFCATKVKGPVTLEIGKAACAALEPALKGVFSNLISVAAASSASSAQVVLLPGFVDTRTVRAGINSLEVTIDLEWNVKDTSGSTVWIETLPVSVKASMGATIFTEKKNMKSATEDLAEDAAKQSATTMAAAPELIKLARRLALTEAPAALPSPQGPPVATAGAGGNGANSYTLEYIHSDRKFKKGFSSGSADTYDQMSEYLSTQIVGRMERKGFHRATSSEIGGCCKLTVELLTVKTHRTLLTDDGIDVTANVKFTDASSNLLYTKEYRGEGLVSPGHIERVETLIHRAVMDMVKNIFIDESLDQSITRALNAGAK